MQAIYIIDTVLQNARIYFDIIAFNGMTENCNYGGFWFSYDYKYKEMGSNQYHHESMSDYDHSDVPFEQWTAKYGPYCTRCEACPLSGLLTNMYLSKGRTRLVFYALPPFFNISLVIRVVPVECEGVTNIVYNYCDRNFTEATFVKPTYHVSCKQLPTLILSESACIVLQHLSGVHRKCVIFQVFSLGMMKVRLQLVHSKSIPHWFKLLCKENVGIVQRTSHSSIVRVDHGFGQNIGIDGSSEPSKEEHDDIIETTLSLKESCLSIPTLYYQYQITNYIDFRKCLVSEMGLPKYKSFRNGGIEKEQPILASCALIMLTTFKGFYVLNMVCPVSNIVATKMYYFYHVHWSSSCTTHDHVNLYFTKYLPYRKSFTSYLLPNNLDKLIFFQYTELSYLNLEISVSKKCQIAISFNRPSNPQMSTKHRSTVFKVGNFTVSTKNELL